MQEKNCDPTSCDTTDGIRQEQAISPNRSEIGPGMSDPTNQNAQTRTFRPPVFGAEKPIQRQAAQARSTDPI